MQYVNFPNKLPKRIRNRQGNVTILIMAIIVIVVAAVQTSLFQTASSIREMKKTRTAGVRNDLASHIKNFASLPTTFRASLDPGLASTINPELHNCIFGTGPALCQADGIEMPLTLYKPVSTLGTPPSQIIAGPGPIGAANAKPALYDIKGGLCKDSAAQTATAECPFEVYSTFVATCAGGASSCATAENISVRYILKTLNSQQAQSGYGMIQLATVDQFAAAVPRLKILPDSIDSSTGIVSVLLHGKGTTTSSVTQTVPRPPLTLEDIKAAVIKGGISPTNYGMLGVISETFLAAGYNDPEFITAVVAANEDTPMLPNVIAALAGAGITDTKAAAFLSKVGIYDSRGMQVVLDSKVTNAFLAHELLWEHKDWNAAQLAAAVASVAGLPDNALTAAVASKGFPNRAAIDAALATVSGISNLRVAASLVKLGIADPSRINAISSAVSEVPDEQFAGFFASMEVGNKAIANQLWSIVNSAPNRGIGSEAMWIGGGDPAKTQKALNDMLAGIISGPEVTTVGTITPISNTQYTTITVDITSPTAPETLTMISPCTSNCTKITF